MSKLTQAAAGAYALMSVVTAVAYAIDKHRAQRQSGSRIRERTLHLLELAFGWPGALVAQHLFRHKRRKPAFYLITWLIGIAHLLAWWLVLRRR